MKGIVVVVIASLVAASCGQAPPSGTARGDRSSKSSGGVHGQICRERAFVGLDA